MKCLAIIEVTDKGTIITFDDDKVFDLCGVSGITHDTFREMLEHVKQPAESAEQAIRLWAKNESKGQPCVLVSK